MITLHTINLDNKSYSYNTSNCSVDIDLSRFEENLKDAQVALNLDILYDTEPYVRYDTGRLNERSIYQNTRNRPIGVVMYYSVDDYTDKKPNRKIITYYPYAKYTYYATHNEVTRRWHPQARPLWFEYSKSLNKEKWIAHVKKVAGGGNNAK